MTRIKFLATAGACLLAIGLVVTPSVQTNVLDAIGDVGDSAARSIVRPLWPFAHGKCATVDRFDLTSPHCL